MVAQLTDPVGTHAAMARTGLATCDKPVDAGQVEAFERSQQRLGGDETDSGRDLTEVVGAVDEAPHGSSAETSIQKEIWLLLCRIELCSAALLDQRGNARGWHSVAAAFLHSRPRRTCSNTPEVVDSWRVTARPNTRIPRCARRQRPVEPPSSTSQARGGR